jgi:hypothetical protein
LDRADPPDLLDPERLLHPQKEPRAEPVPDSANTKPDDTSAVKSHGFSPYSNPNPMLPGFDRLQKRKKRK